MQKASQNNSNATEYGKDKGPQMKSGRRTRIIVVMLTILLFVTGFKVLDVELLVDGRLLDLDQVIKDMPPGGGNATESSDPSDTAQKSEGKESGKSDSKLKDNAPVYIRVRGNKVFCNGSSFTNELLRLKLEQTDTKKNKVILTDAYADYKTYLKVVDLLDEMGIPYTTDME